MRVEFNVLGPLEVKVDGRVVEVGAKMHRAVLASLLIDANRVVSVDRLLDALWGERPPQTATNALQGYVAGLRRVLEPDRAPRSAPRLLVTQSPGYVLRVDPDAVDAVRFEAAAAQGHAHLAAGRPSAAREALTAGLALWRGAPFADLEYERFVRPEVTRLTEGQAIATEDLAEALLALGEAPIAELESLVEADPLRERRWYLLMLGLYRAGRQADALRAYSHARRTLVEELGIEPGPTLRQLEEDILRQAPGLDWRPPPDAGPTQVRRGAARLAFVGRTAELDVLEAALDEALSGRANVVLISGEPGIGKSRLASEVTVRASDRGAAVAWGRCVEGHGAPAFWPWTQVVRALLAGVPSEAATMELTDLVPDVGIEGLDPEKARFRLYDAVCRLLRERTAERPLVLVLDDVHWADAASLQLLRFVAMDVVSSPLLVLATYRDTEPTSSPALRAALADLHRAGATDLRLSGLGRGEVADLVQESRGEMPSARLVEVLCDRSGGNPFFVAQLVKLLERGERETALAAELPRGVRDVIRHRVGQLPGDTPALLTLAAVMGREFEFAALVRTAGRDDQEVLPAIEAALQAGIVVEAPEDVGRFRFVHALVVETLYEELSSVRRAQLHARVGEALEQAGNVDAVQLAHHFWRAIPAGAHDQALRHAFAAAEQAKARLAYEQAEEQLRRALDAVAARPPGPDRMRRELEVQTRLWVLLAPLRGYADKDAAARARRARELSLELGDTTHLRGPLWGLWVFHTIRAEFDSAEVLAQEMLEAHGRDGDPLWLVAAHHGLGIVATHRAELATARHHLQAAVAAADTAPEQAQLQVFGYHPRVVHRSNLATVLAMLGEEAAAVKTAEDAQALAVVHGHRYTSAISQFFDAWTAVHLGDVGRARRCSEKAIAACEEGGFRMWPAAAGVIHGWAEALEGRAETGAEEAAAALAAWEETGAGAFRPFLRGLLAEAAWRAGRPADALALVAEALEIVAATDDRFYEARLHRLRSEISLQHA